MRIHSPVSNLGNDEEVLLLLVEQGELAEELDPVVRHTEQQIDSSIQGIRATAE